MRIADVKSRRKTKRFEQANRDEALKLEAERQEKTDAYLEEKKAEFEAKLAEEKEARRQLRADAGEAEPEEDEYQEEFDETQNAADFDEDNTPVDIPPEIVPDVDNDFSDSLEGPIDEGKGDE